MPFPVNTGPLAAQAVKPCKHGHTSGRDARKRCKECHRLREFARYRDNPQDVMRRRTERPKPPSQTPEGRRAWTQKNPERQMLHTARARAKKEGYACNIDVTDIVVPKFCPLLGIRLKRTGGRRSDISPSLDKMIPELGYVRGNVWVISWRANRLKNDATLDELRKLVDNLTETIRTRFPWEGR